MLHIFIANSNFYKLQNVTKIKDDFKTTTVRTIKIKIQYITTIRLDYYIIIRANGESDSYTTQPYI
jgi:hypothetical protein